MKYTSPVLTTFGTFRDLTLDRWAQMSGRCGGPGLGKNTPAQDPCLPLGVGINDGPRS